MNDFPVVFLTTVYKCTITLIEFQLEKSQANTNKKIAVIKCQTLVYIRITWRVCKNRSLGPVSKSVGQGWDSFLVGPQVVLLLLVGKPHFKGPWFDVRNL